MEFSNGKYLLFVTKSEDIPDRVLSKKGWLLLHELTNFNIKDIINIIQTVNIKFNTVNLNCKYISK